MIKALSILGFFVAAMPVLAQENAPEPAELSEAEMKFVMVFGAYGCTLATGGADAIPEEELMEMFSIVGIDEQQVAELADKMIESGRARVDLSTDALTILPPLCEPLGNE